MGENMTKEVVIEDMVYSDDDQLEVVIRWLAGGVDRSLGRFHSITAVSIKEKLTEPMGSFPTVRSCPIRDMFTVVLLDGNREVVHAP